MRRGGIIRGWAFASGLAGMMLLGVVLGQSAPTLTIEREDATIVITQRAQSAAGARFVPGNKNCEEGILTSIFYGPPPGFIETVIDNTRLTSTAAIIRAPRENGGGEGQGKDQQTIDLFGGSVNFNRPGCPEEITRSEEATVTLEQGRTMVHGSSFFLDRGTDIGHMAGPVTLERAAAGEASALEASADALELNVATERSTLSGNVRVVSGERVSEAEALELNEDEGLAIMTGNPARSREGDNVLEGMRLLYYLDSNDVVVVGNVRGTLEVELR